VVGIDEISIRKGHTSPKSRDRNSAMFVEQVVCLVFNPFPSFFS
jgi:hypothetical protein